MSGAASPAGYGASPRIIPRNLSNVVPVTAAYSLIAVEFSRFGNLNTVIDSGTGGLVTNRLPEWWGQPDLLSNVGKDFEVALFLLAGPPPGGDPSGVWLSLDGVDREWSYFQVGVGTTSGTWRLQIRGRGTSQVLSSADYNVTCTKNP